MEQTKYDVFISYSRKDYVDEHKNVIPGNEVSKIKEALTEAGITYWFDEEGVYSGNEFAKVIVKSIKASNIFVFLSTINSNRSEWTANEISTAYMLKKKIIPVRIDDSVYHDDVILYISRLSHIDYKDNPEKGMKELIRSINSYLAEEQMEKAKKMAEERRVTDLKVESSRKITNTEVVFSRITDVQPAVPYAKKVETLLQIGHRIEKSADLLLDKDVDYYLLTKYITRYHRALHCINMEQFNTDLLNITNGKFVYNHRPIAKYNQKDEKQFKESVKLFFFESYLQKYISALMVFNETMAGLHHLVDGMKENDTKVFSQYRNELMKVFKELELEVHSVKIFDSITDYVDLRIEMRPLDFNCPSGTICQINSCLVYLAGGNKPNDKIHVIVKE